MSESYEQQPRGGNIIAPDLEKLTPKEKCVATLMIYGKDRREVAATLFLSENTVKTHIRNILRKTGLKNQKALMSKFLIK